MLLVAAAALLAVGAAVLLVLGWSTSDATLALVSTLVSGFAALFLVAAARAGRRRDDGDRPG